MIEAAEFATPSQRLQHAHYLEIHRKFFPKPPPFPKLIEPAPPTAEPAPEPPPPCPELPPLPVKPIGIEETRLRLRIIKQTVCHHYQISKQTLLSARRTEDIVRPRHLVSYLASRLTKASLPQIGRTLDQDHTTILHGIRRTEQRIHADYKFGERVMQIVSHIRRQLGETGQPHGCVARYVAHADVMDYFKLGWMWAANLNEYAALLIWPCSCPFVEPKQ